MGLSQTILFYLLFGTGIAAAVGLTNGAQSRAARLFRVLTAVFFWPLYLPTLLDRSGPAPSPVPAGKNPATEAQDAFAAAIAQVEAELETALDSLDGWAENVLAREEDRFAELRAAWRVQAQRIREIDRLLAERGDRATRPEASAGPGGSGNVRYRQSEQARRENFERLRTVRERMHDDLLGTLAWVRELVSMIHLAKFTGAPASRAEELVSQIATAVQGLSEVNQWQQEPAGIHNST